MGAGRTSPDTGFHSILKETPCTQGMEEKIMKTAALLLVISYAVLMLYALWKQKNRNICMGAGCLLLLAYALLFILKNRSPMPLLLLGMLCISAGALLNGIRQKKVHLLHHLIRLLLEAAIAALCWISLGGI